MSEVGVKSSCILLRTCLGRRGWSASIGPRIRNSAQDGGGLLAFNSCQFNDGKGNSCGH